MMSLFLIGSSGISYGQDSSDPVTINPISIREAPKADNNIRISADHLMVASGNNTAVFTGNVRAIQGNLAITADEIKILFHDDMGVETIGTANEMDFRQIVARGNVSLTFDNKMALADQAVYHTDTQILVLSGGNTRVLMGESSITGTRITLHRIDGRVEVEGEGKTRVEGVFFNEKSEKGLLSDGQPSP
jgi:lipopolysaccharide export system protein LptA